MRDKRKAGGHEAACLLGMYKPGSAHDACVLCTILANRATLRDRIVTV